MKARIVDPQVKVYGSMDVDSPSLTSLSAGDEIEFSPAKRKGGRQWVPITFSTGQQAFIPGDAHIFVIQLGSLLKDGVEVHTEPNADSPVKLTLAKKTRIYILHVIKTGQSQWVKVRDMSGNEGYINGETRIKLIQQLTKSLGMKNVRSGAMWLIAGLIITFAGNSPGPGSFYSLFGYIALFFGVVMLALGGYQYIRAPT